MTVNLKINLIQIELSKGLSKARGWEGEYKKAYVKNETWKKGLKTFGKYQN